jgi:hypothetical protein
MARITYVLRPFRNIYCFVDCRANRFVFGGCRASFVFGGKPWWATPCVCAFTLERCLHLGFYAAAYFVFENNAALLLFG